MVGYVLHIEVFMDLPGIQLIGSGTIDEKHIFLRELPWLWSWKQFWVRIVGFVYPQPQYHSLCYIRLSRLGKAWHLMDFSRNRSEKIVQEE